MKPLTIAGQYGDLGTAVKIRPLHMHLQSCIDEYVLSPASANIQAISVIIAVSGSLDKYDFRGPSRVRLEVSRGRASFWIGVSEQVAEYDEKGIKSFLGDSLLEGIHQVDLRVADKGLGRLAPAFLQDVNRSVALFLRSSSPAAKDINWGPIEVEDVPPNLN